MSDEIRVEIVGLDKVLEAFEKFPGAVARNLGQAGKEAAQKAVLNTRGMQKYPPATAANKPPTPYYIRGRGMQYKSRNNYSSENLGKQWYVHVRGGTEVVIGNPTSYAPFVHGEEQARAMRRIGWRKLADTVKARLGEFRKIYQRWINKTIRQLGL